MSELVVFLALVIEVGIIIFALSLLRESRWNLFCDTLDNLPENIKRLAAWHMRRAVRNWYRVLGLIQAVKTRF